MSEMTMLPGTAVVFGAASGIGRATARALIDTGRYSDLLAVDVAPVPAADEYVRADMSDGAAREMVI